MRAGPFVQTIGSVWSINLRPQGAAAGAGAPYELLIYSL